MFLWGVILLVAGFVAFKVGGGFAVAMIAVGVIGGAKIGGHYYMRRLSEYEHSVRVSRSGLGRRS